MIAQKVFCIENDLPIALKVGCEGEILEFKQFTIISKSELKSR